MPVSFNSITDIRVPFVAVEFDNSKAQQGPAIQPFQTLMLGQKTSAGTHAALTPITVSSEAQARTLFGAGSMLQWMVKRYLQNDLVTQLVVIAVDDLPAGVKATKTLTVTGPATADGTLEFYFGGKKVQVGVLSGDTANAIAAAINAAINADTDLQCVSTVLTNVVTAEFKHKGVLGNEFDIRLNHFEDEETPAGVAVVIAAGVTGTGNPDVSTITAVIPEEQFNTIVNAWTDSTNLGYLETELAQRFGPMQAIDGVAITTKFGSLGSLSTLGNGRNSPHSCISGPAKSAPNPPWEWSAARAGQVAKSAQADPARPFQTLPLAGLLAPKLSEQFILSERNTLLFDGIATDKVVGGVAQIERLITTFQTNAAAQPDTSYLDAETLYTLSYLRYSFRNRFASRYPRHKLADDGTRFGPGQAVITPKIARAESVSLFGEWELAGLVEGVDQFKRDLVVERNQSNPNRLDFLLPPDLINQLRNIGAQIQFLL